MEKKYYWDYNKHRFELYVGNSGLRWNDEGVLQNIKLNINKHTLIDNNWGIQQNLDYITNVSTKEFEINHDYSYKNHLIYIYKNKISFKIDDMNGDVSIILQGKEYKEFITWVKSCLSPKSERIKIKINKILENKKEKI